MRKFQQTFCMSSKLRIPNSIWCRDCINSSFHQNENYYKSIKNEGFCWGFFPLEVYQKGVTKIFDEVLETCCCDKHYSNFSWKRNKPKISCFWIKGVVKCFTKAGGKSGWVFWNFIIYFFLLILTSGSTSLYCLSNRSSTHENIFVLKNL